MRRISFLTWAALAIGLVFGAAVYAQSAGGAAGVGAVGGASEIEPPPGVNGDTMPPPGDQNFMYGVTPQWNQDWNPNMKTPNQNQNPYRNPDNNKNDYNNTPPSNP